MAVPQAILPIFLLIVLGYFLRQRGTLTAESNKAFGEVAFKIFMPMVLFTGMAKAPLVEVLATYDNEKIIAALNAPVPMMAGAVGGMSDEDKRNVAVFLTKKSLPASGALPEVKAE